MNILVIVLIILGVLALILALRNTKEPIDPLEFSEEQYEKMRKDYTRENQSKRLLGK